MSESDSHSSELFDDSGQDSDFDPKKQYNPFGKELLSSSEEEAVRSTLGIARVPKRPQKKKGNAGTSGTGATTAKRPRVSVGERPGASGLRSIGAASATDIQSLGNETEGTAGDKALSDDEPETPAILSNFEESEPSDEESERLAAQMTNYPYHSLMEKIPEESRRTEMRTAFHSFARPPTPLEVKTLFGKKIEQKEQELTALRKEQENCLALSKQFWSAVKKEQKLKLRAHIGSVHRPRPRKTNLHKGRLQKSCPLSGCVGRCQNIRRHIAQCHRYLSKAAQSKIMKAFEEFGKKSSGSRSIKRTSKDRYPSRICIVCNKVVKRIDVHAEKVHFAKRGTSFYEKIRKESPLMHPESSETVKEGPTRVQISSIHGLTVFLNEFEKYLKNCTPLAKTTITAQLRMVGDIVSSSLLNDSDSNLSGCKIVQLLTEVDNEDPPGLFTLKRDVLSANYKRKIVFACTRAIEFMAITTNETFQISEDEKRQATRKLKIITMKYKKEEKKQSFKARRKKERENVNLNVVESILKAPYITATLENAVKSLDDSNCRPSSLSDFTSLRDVLILVLMTKSLRRAMEFAEFTLSEYSEMQQQTDFYIVRIANHKTAQQGPALLFLSENEAKALEAYVKYFRPLASACSSPDCFVFVSRSSDECCEKLSLSNIGRMIRKTVQRAGKEIKINSRILRRTQITALWQTSDDPSWRLKVATQCGHSLETASRYYEFSEKIGTGKTVIDRLSQLRQHAAPRGKQQRKVSTVEASAEEEQARTEVSSEAEGGEEFVEAASKAEGGEEFVEAASEAEGGEEFVRPATPQRPQSDPVEELSVFSRGSTSITGDVLKEISGLSRASISIYGRETDDMNIISAASTETQPEDDRCARDCEASMTPKAPANTFWSDVNIAIKACDRSKRKSQHAVVWREVKCHMTNQNPFYDEWSTEKIRNKYKYLKKRRKIS